MLIVSLRLGVLQSGLNCRYGVESLRDHYFKGTDEVYSSQWEYDPATRPPGVDQP